MVWDIFIACWAALSIVVISTFSISVLRAIAFCVGTLMETKKSVFNQLARRREKQKRFTMYIAILTTVLVMCWLAIYFAIVKFYSLF